jgi:hypothetical protein
MPMPFFITILQIYLQHKYLINAFNSARAHELNEDDCHKRNTQLEI